MNVLMDLQEMLNDQLKSIAKKGDITPTELENTYKAIDIIKDIETINAMRNADDGYSQAYRHDMDYSMTGHSMNGGSYDGNSYTGRRGRDGDGDGRYSEGYGNSTRRGRDARGRYTSRDNGSYGSGMYSRDAGKEKMLDELSMMMNTAKTEHEREAIRQCIEKLDN